MQDISKKGVPYNRFASIQSKTGYFALHEKHIYLRTYFCLKILQTFCKQKNSEKYLTYVSLMFVTKTHCQQTHLMYIYYKIESGQVYSKFSDQL